MIKLFKKRAITYFFIFFCLASNGQEVKNINPKKAAILSAIIPGSGQIYAKKYWKTPIIYAGLATSIYYINENLELYQSYKTAYISRINNSNAISEFDKYSNTDLTTLTEHYRRNTEVSILFCALIYTLNIIDASVSAHLLDYNISEDISMRIKPTTTYSQNNFNTGLSLLIKL
tara:strand:+ start:1270 stop:1791 length:522 start_codon:yes stop_codon:yes gene_type:complete